MVTDVDSTSEQSFGDKAKSWAISAFGWLIVAVIIYFLVDWLFSTLAIAFKAVFSVAIVGLMVFGYVKLRRNKRRRDAPSARESSARIAEEE